MAISGTSPFSSPGWTPQSPFPSQNSLLAPAPLPISLPAPQLPTPSSILPPSPLGLSPVGPAVNGLVPVIRNPGISGLNSAFTPPNGLSGNPLSSSPVDVFSPSQRPTPQPLSPASLPAPSVDSLTSASATTASATPTGPLNAQQMGQKVGGIFSNFLEENPAVLEKLNNVDLDEIEQNVGPKVEGLRAQFQQALKKIPEGVDKRLIRMLDPGTQEIAMEVDQWLRKEPDAATLAELAAKKRAKAREDALGGKPARSRIDPLEDPLVDDPFADEDPFAETLSPKKETYRDKLLNAKDQLVDKAKSSWPLNRSKSDFSDFEEEPVIRPRRKPSLSEMSDAELDALLGGGPTFKANGNHK
jgi:hypothetical protein